MLNDSKTISNLFLSLLIFNFKPMAKTYQKKETQGNSKKPAGKKVSKPNIRKRAYEIYLDRKDENGSAESDWLIAEDELFFNSDF